MSMNKAELLTIIKSIAPEELMEAWDNSGIQIDTGKKEINKVLVCLDLDHHIIEEAIKEKADFIISHHPLLFHHIKNIDATTYLGKVLVTLIQNDIGAYAAHTSFDQVKGGNNDYLCNLLGLTQIKTIENIPILRVAAFKEEKTMSEMLKDMTVKLHTNHLSYVGDLSKIIKNVAVCTGAGASFIQDAAMLGCDLLLTGDLKYHEAQLAKQLNMNVIDGGHYETELIFIENFAQLLSQQLQGRVEVVKGQTQQEAINKFYLES